MGYSAAALDGWARRAEAWAAGGAPEDQPLLTKAPVAPDGREVFLYVISGGKGRNPAAAMALIERLR
jgi:putative intracellular protease/amidase